MKSEPGARLMRTRVIAGQMIIAIAVLCFGSSIQAGPAHHHKAARQESSDTGQSSTLLPNGNWLLLGGVDANGKPESTAFVRNSETGSVSPLSGKLIYPRAWHTATMLPDGTVFVFGGLAEGSRL